MSKMNLSFNCPCCKKELDAATSINEKDALPSPGNLSICFYCATVSRFDKDLKLEELTTEQFAKFPEEFKINVRNIREKILEFNIKAGK
jgi:hypothetical protein